MQVNIRRMARCSTVSRSGDASHLLPQSEESHLHARVRYTHGCDDFMLIHELTREECLDVLGRNTLGRLACVQDGQPYIVPVSFNLDGSYIYGFATVGQKVRWMRANPLVCLEVEEITDRRHWTTVIAFGLYEELTDSPEHAEGQRRAQELFSARDRWWEPATGKTALREPHAAVLYRITVNRLTGRSASQNSVPSSAAE